MNALEITRMTLLSPAVLAFGLGILARFVRSDLKMPEGMSTALSIYLLLAIGMKGGAELSATPLTSFAGPLAATLLLGLVTPLIAFAVAYRLGKLDVANAAALAAHYGSVSVVTFTATLSFLQIAGISAEKYLPALVVALEVPAIVIALAIANRLIGGERPWWAALHEVFAGKSVVLLAGGLLIGLIAGQSGLARVAPLFVEPFQGVLMLFLLDMGLLALARLGDLKSTGAFLPLFAIIVPLVHGTIGVALATLCGMSVGGATVLGAMAASASYIAAPAAVRAALPEANPSLYLTASIGITFPFNLVVGIPIYLTLAQLFANLR